MTILDDLRAVGLPMISRYRPIEAHSVDENGEDVRVVTQQFVSWTTDRAKADAARDFGATVRHYSAHDPSASGYEVAVSVVVE